MINRLASRVGGDHVLRIAKRSSIDPRRAYATTPATDAPAEAFALTTRQAAKVETNRHGEPVAMQWRGRCAVVRYWGPERIETGWWRGRSVRRDAWWVELDNGARLWLHCDLRRRQWRVLVGRAAELGYAALAVTDRNSLAGVVRAYVAAKEAGLPLVVGAELTLAEAPTVVVWATDRASYGRLCRLLTTGLRRAEKGSCELRLDDLAENSAGLMVGVTLEEPAANLETLGAFRDLFGDRGFLLADAHRGGDDRSRLAAFAALSQRSGLPMVASGDVHYHAPERRLLHDVLTAIRLGETIEAADGAELLPNGERCLRSREDLARLFRDWPDALARTAEIAERCRFSLDELRFEYPEELAPVGKTELAWLTELTQQGAEGRYPEGVPEKVRQQIDHELRLIAKLRYEAYFLTVWDLVRFARSRGILCQGRGSAANSAVCYCLG
ncbi:dnaE2, partial [Symbiodinium sp. CCMP2456]